MMNKYDPSETNGNMNWGDEHFLIEQLKLGNEAALKVIIDKYYRMLCHYCIHIINNEPIAREIVSDVFYSLWKRKSQLEEIHALEPFLFTSARNASINYQKLEKRKRDRELTIPRVAEENNEIQNEEKITTQEVDAVYQAIEKLPSQLKQVMQLYLKGAPTKDISAILNISQATVRSYKRVAINNIKAIILDKMISFTILIGLFKLP